MDVDNPGTGYTSLQSLGSSDQESSGSECPITCPTHTASEQPGLCPQWPRPPLPGMELRCRAGEGQSSSLSPGQGAAGPMSSFRVVADVLSSVVSGTSQGSLGLHWKGLMGRGSPRSSTFTTPAPGLSCALAPGLPHQQQLFLFPAFSVNSPCCGGDGAAGGEGGA